MQENGIYSVISPEGCATILWRDVSKARQAANSLGLTSEKLKELGLIDEILPEPVGGAHRDAGQTYSTVKQAIERNLNALRRDNGDSLVEARYQKYRLMGRFREASNSELPSHP